VTGVRRGESTGWIRAAIYFTAFAGLGGVLSGLLLGVAGSHVSVGLRVALGSLLATVGLLFGAFDLVERPIRPLQCDRETPKSWVDEGRLFWATKNGIALGCGATSRIGFWLWYAIPAGAFLEGRAILGALVYGSYGLSRGLGVWGFLLSRVSTDSEVFLARLMGRRRALQSLTAAGLIFLCAYTIGAVGLR
jgi:hypothetical protein